jgi:hypothetical protein
MQSSFLLGVWVFIATLSAVLTTYVDINVESLFVEKSGKI